MYTFEVIDIDETIKEIVKECDSSCKNKITIDKFKYESVKNDLLEGKTVFFNTLDKSISSNYKNKKMALSAKKNAVANKIKQKFLSLNDTSVLIDIIFYIDAAAELADAGYFITDKNREEKYIEIIESEDESLIDLLEEYLTIKDEISKIKWHKKQYNKAMKKLKELDENSDEFEKFIKEI